MTSDQGEHQKVSKVFWLRLVSPQMGFPYPSLLTYISKHWGDHTYNMALGFSSCSFCFYFFSFICDYCDNSFQVKGEAASFTLWQLKYTMQDFQVTSLHLCHQSYTWNSNIRNRVLRTVLNPSDSNSSGVSKCITHFPHCCGKTPRKKTFREGRLRVGLHSREHSPLWWRNCGSWSTAGHIASALS